MEASHDMHYEKGNLSSEKSKRRFKTPAQVLALEELYNEHKYPSESMKSEFAEQIGLSEKQVSGWFCHRRSKDKKLMQDEVYTNRDQECSNGANAVHESISGHRQESCSSTKQVDRHFDGKEVESNSFHGQKISHAIPEQRGQPFHVECYDSTDERSSGSSTTSYERFLKQGVDNCPMKPRYPFGDESYMLTDIRGAKERGFKVSARSANIESPVVAMVKLKLGGQYREDGPLLATDFDPLPPGAFDSPITASNSEPLYVGDPIQKTSRSIHLTVGEHKLIDGLTGDCGHQKRQKALEKSPREQNEMYDKLRHERISSGPCPEGSGFNIKLRRSNHWSDFAGCQLNRKASDIENKDHIPFTTYMMGEESKDFAGEASDDYRRKNKRFFNHCFAGESDNSSTHPSQLNSLKDDVNKPLLYPLPNHKYNDPISQRELFQAKISKPTIKRKTNEFLPTGGRMQGRGMLKVLKKKIHKENRFHETLNSICPEMFRTSDAQMARKVHGKCLMKKSEFYARDLP